MKVIVHTLKQPYAEGPAKVETVIVDVSAVRSNAIPGLPAPHLTIDSSSGSHFFDHVTKIEVWP